MVHWRRARELKGRLLLLPEEQRPQAKRHMMLGLACFTGALIGQFVAVKCKGSWSVILSSLMTVFHVVSFYGLFRAAISQKTTAGEASGATAGGSSETKTPPTTSSSSGGRGWWQRQEERPQKCLNLNVSPYWP
eukprot:SAG11_NODE_71_length_18338_cov_14.752974_11_plen_134_part_00